MNEDQFKGKWKQLKGEVEKNWGKLTGDDVDRIEGDLTKLVGRVQEEYGYTREQAEEEVQDFLNDFS